MIAREGQDIRPFLYQVSDIKFSIRPSQISGQVFDLEMDIKFNFQPGLISGFRPSNKAGYPTNLILGPSLIITVLLY